MQKIKTVFCCSECGYISPRWLGKCPTCNEYNTLIEEVKKGKEKTESKSSSAVTTLKNIPPISGNRIKTNLTEFDRVLSGGIPEGSLILVGGDPGIGKSTMLLQICEGIGKDSKTILYVSGEESLQQIKMRAERLEVTTENLYLLSETNITTISETVEKMMPDLLVIDSIQTMYNEDLTGVSGSVSQVREATSVLMKIAKKLNISVVVIGHVTKEGSIAGPKILEHMVDTVLYFEGEKRETYRIIRAVKNRFGATDEIGVFEMRDKGLFDIKNPSEYMLSGRPLNVSGSVVTCCMEGTRPLLAEIQALVSYTNFGLPRRMATGLDYNRITMLIAVLEKRGNLKLSSYDVHVNIAGGIKIVEPALDVAVALAVASSYENKNIDPYLMAFGEIGLTGELRAVTNAEKRVLEAYRLGFNQCIIPQANIKGLKKPEGIKVYGVSSIGEMLDLVF